MAERLTAKYRRLVADPNALEDEGRASVSIDVDDVEVDLSTHAERYLEWGRLATMAEADYLGLKDEVTRMENECKSRARTKLAGAGEKITEGRVEEVSSLDPALLRVKEMARKQHEVWKHFERVQQAMWQRQGMLQSLNSRQVRELSLYKDDPEYYSAVKQNQEDLEELKARARESQGR